MLTKNISFPVTVPEYTQRTITAIAYKQRLWANQNYKRYNMQSNMCGMCAIMTGRILRAMDQRGLKTFRAGLSKDHVGSHVFVVSRDLIIDVTATQFGEDEICILPINDRTEWYWKPVKLFNNITHLREFQVENNWGQQCVETTDQINTNGFIF